METFKLKFDEHDQIFHGLFENISKDILTRMKKEGYLEKVVVDLFPETFSGEIIIDDSLENDLDYQVDFYLDLVATPKMEKAITKRKNRNIEINEKDDMLEISIEIVKKSSAIQISDDGKEIILTI